jgi:hypothetical protein
MCAPLKLPNLSALFACGDRGAQGREPRRLPRLTRAPATAAIFDSVYAQLDGIERMRL